MSRVFQLEVDASAVGAGAVLLQEGADGVAHPVSYFSAKFNHHQLNYLTIEKETLALLLALGHFDVYIGGSMFPVTVYTDHNPLVFLSKMYNHNQRLMRLALIVQPYNLEIRHKRGSENVVADALSRSCWFSEPVYFLILPKGWRWKRRKLFLFLGGEVLRSKLGCPYFVGIGMSFYPLCCTDLVYSFLPRLSSDPTHLRLVRWWPSGSNIRWKLRLCWWLSPLQRMSCHSYYHSLQWTWFALVQKPLLSDLHWWMQPASFVRVLWSSIPVKSGAYCAFDLCLMCVCACWSMFCLLYKLI